jgi:hypothetical protein
MIVVRMELWVKGREDLKRDLGMMVIGNDRTGDQEHGNYNVRIGKSPVFSPRNAARHPVELFLRSRVWRSGRVEGFPRVSRRLGPWDLLFRALQATVGSRNA